MPLNQFFYFKKGELHCEGLPVSKIAGKVETPFYLYSQSSFQERFLSLKKALKPLDPLICYAMKANSNLAVLKTLVKLGAGLDIVSEGELFRALKAGCHPRRIVFAGVGKSESEIRAALKVGIFSFNVESKPELAFICKIAGQMGKKARVALRINPNVDAKTHKKITTGKAENKFGIDLDTAERIFLKQDRFPNLDIRGIHVHIGSQITRPEPFEKALRRVLAFVRSLEKKGVVIDSLDLGGGLGIRYHKEHPLTPQEYASRILPLLKNTPYKIICEPGRFISGNSGILVSQVLYTKRSRTKNFVIVDAAMSELIRPSMYEAYHEICPVKKIPGREVIKADVVGPICETGDVLGYNRTLQESEPGELVAILSAGAYGFSMSSNYNARPRPAEILVKGNKFKVVRKRETLQDLIRGEKF